MTTFPPAGADDAGVEELSAPPPAPTRWVIRRKAEVVEAVRDGRLSLEEACRRYALTVDEFDRWRQFIDRHGLPGLRATRVQHYRRAAPR
ncbi:MULTISPECIES: DUF1153 domain-containing protein [Methylosinus]|uniref:DUF1153 domain-containing protein n=1 Tax=Methylosinus trichosporium (strain ATCC 35070 / NCIMB 11131 / UNIQEM 75 / OB3b) TaxID=595536 RepID=A0A2D2CVD5_METT3|nr:MULTISPECIES: DUF1153 domain-containing protein [Methylosinus]ATQ66728.1 DUF1153 domain-containing protein [Methylosinus trichosporium OB3b]OBS53395.1 hypothetical protein A8B73_06380 [Methylosinus sp. 3S-1]